MKTIFLHPFFVHFPIVFFAFEFLLLSQWMRFKDPAYRRFALLSFKLGYGTMLAAAASGYLDSGGIRQMQGVLREHFYFAAAGLVWVTLRAIYWKIASASSEFSDKMHWAGSAIGCALIFWAAFLGARVVYS